MRNRAFAVATVLLLIAGLAWAGEVSGRMDPAAKAAMLQEELSLTDDQTEKVAVLIEDIHNRLRELRADRQSNAAEDEAKEQLKAEFYSRFNSILTDDQIARYEALEVEHAGQERNYRQ